MSGDGEEVSAIVEGRPPLIDQSKVGLIDERARLEDMVGAFATHQAMRHAVELVMDELDQTIQGCSVTALPAMQQPRDVGRRRLSHQGQIQRLRKNRTEPS